MYNTFVWEDDAVAHTANNSADALVETFGGEGRDISKWLWFPWSPDLNLCDFHLSDGLKKKMYVSILHSREKLDENIRHEIHAFLHSAS
jgi:hypothetical protein